MHDALTESDLVMVLNSWAGNTDDAPYWNRKEKYVAAVSKAALWLPRAGLIEVWERPGELRDDTGLLLPQTAEQVLATTSNWWQYDPAAQSGDEDETRAGVNEREEPPTPPAWVYKLFATERGHHLERDGGEHRARPDLRSPGLRRQDEERQLRAARWTAISRAVVEGQRTGLLCPENQDADLDIEWKPNKANDDENSEQLAYRRAGTTIMTCPGCGATQELRHMARR
jgi:hypothetical protein